MIKEEEVLVTGGSGMVGSALRLLIPDAIYISSKDFDLRSEEDANNMFVTYAPKYVIHLAAKVGGVKANTDFVGDFFTDNIRINTNVLDCAKTYKVEKVLSLLSTCVYPDDPIYPLTESQIHNGAPHKSNFGYAHAKRMLDVQSRAYRQQYGCNFVTAVPNNLFGEHDNFEEENSHVIPAIIRKVYEARVTGEDIRLWGDGAPLREFTYSHDLARILLFLLERYNEPGPINIGNPNEYSIKAVSNMIADILEYKKVIFWDVEKPSGQFKKPSSNDKLLSLGWNESGYTDFEAALTRTCRWFEENYHDARGI